MPIRVLAAAALVTVLCGCETSAQRAAAAATGGDPGRGRSAIGRYGCGSCHEVKGVAGANGLVGPSLNRVGQHVYVAGVLQNTPGNLVHWVQDPTGVNEKTAMPKLGVTDQDAIDIAAYLYSLD
jgi:cytochrome c